MGNRLTAEQRKIMEEGHALVVHCDECQSEMFLAELPLEGSKLSRLIGRTKCPSDKSHRLFMGPLKARGPSQ